VQKKKIAPAAGPFFESYPKSCESSDITFAVIRVVNDSGARTKQAKN